LLQIFVGDCRFDNLIEKQLVRVGKVGTKPFVDEGRKRGTEKVSGLNGTAAWGARIYGDGRRTGDSPDRFGRVVLADSTGEQHASRMKGVGRFP
jgi:hypothetical protein